MPTIPKAVTFFAAIAPQGVDVENGRITGMCLMQIGAAQGHGTNVDGKTLDQLVTHCKALPNATAHLVVKHNGHPLDVVADLTQFRRDGDAVRADADIHAEYPDRKRFLEIAKRSPREIGVSAEFKRTDETIGATKFARIHEVRRFALERDTAVNPNGLFSEQTNPDDIDMTPEELTAAIKAGNQPLLDRVAALETKFSEAPKPLSAEDQKKRDDALVLDGMTKFAAQVGIKVAPQGNGEPDPAKGEPVETKFAAKVNEYLKLGGMDEATARNRVINDHPKLYAESSEAASVFGKPK